MKSVRTPPVYDPNVTGRNITPSFSNVLSILRRCTSGDLTPQVRHNGNGLSVCDITLRRVLNDVDWEMTWTNGFMTGIFSGWRGTFRAALFVVRAHVCSLILTWFPCRMSGLSEHVQTERRNCLKAFSQIMVMPMFDNIKRVHNSSMNSFSEGQS